VEKLGIIRGEGGLANRSDQMADLRAFAGRTTFVTFPLQAPASRRLQRAG